MCFQVYPSIINIGIDTGCSDTPWQKQASLVTTFVNQLIGSLLTHWPAILLSFGRSSNFVRQWMCKLLLLGGICRHSIFLNISLVCHGQVWCFSIVSPPNGCKEWKLRKFHTSVAFTRTSKNFARMNSKYTVCFYGLSRSQDMVVLLSHSSEFECHTCPYCSCIISTMWGWPIRIWLYFTSQFLKFHGKVVFLFTHFVIK